MDAQAALNELSCSANLLVFTLGQPPLSLCSCPSSNPGSAPQNQYVIKASYVTSMNAVADYQGSLPLQHAI